MRDLVFYEAGYHEVKGIRRVVIPFRRLLRRLLRPIFLHLDSRLNSLGAELNSLDRRQNLLDRDLKAVVAMGWDHVAMVRRLASLEEHVEALMQRDVMMESDNSSQIEIEAPILKLEESGAGECERARDLHCAC
jgi:hypothetical protein